MQLFQELIREVGDLTIWRTDEPKDSPVATRAGEVQQGQYCQNVQEVSPVLIADSVDCTKRELSTPFEDYDKGQGIVQAVEIQPCLKDCDYPGSETSIATKSSLSIHIRKSL